MRCVGQQSGGLPIHVVTQQREIEHERGVVTTNEETERERRVQHALWYDSLENGRVSAEGGSDARKGPPNSLDHKNGKG